MHRHIELDKQQNNITCVKQDLEATEVKQRLERSQESPPDLVDTDAESDDDGSVSSLPHYNPGGDGRDFWAREEAELPAPKPYDIANKSPLVSPKLPVPTISLPLQSPEEAGSTPPSMEEGTPVGHSADGKSCRIRNLPRPCYNVTLGEKQVPLAVRQGLHIQRISCKHSKYKKRVAKKHHLADELMLSAEVEIPTVEALMACPILKFIQFTGGYTGTCYELIANCVHPLFLNAKCKSSKEDNPNWMQDMNGPFKEEYWKAALKEIETLESMDAWEVVDRDDDNTNVINSIWAFKLKRYLDGMVKKFKAYFCAHGDQQLEGINFFETYAPVVQWISVHLMLILEVLLQLKSKQGNVTAAFLHTNFDQEKEKVYVEMRLGFHQKGKVLKLQKTLNGLCQSPRAFWQFSTDAMIKSGMTVTKLDPCMFVGDKVIAVAFVDDILFWSTDEAYINQLGNTLRLHGLLLE